MEGARDPESTTLALVSWIKVPHITAEALKDWAVFVIVDTDVRTFQYSSDSSREGCDAQLLLM